MSKQLEEIISEKYCPKCETVKSILFFRRRSDRPHQWQSWCVDCYREKNRKDYYQKKDDPKTKEQKKKYWTKTNFKRYYGITVEYYENLFEEQNGVCKICGKTSKENGKRLCVDHCHITSKIRGLLCDACNVGLGRFNDNLELLEKAVEYLKESINE